MFKTKWRLSTSRLHCIAYAWPIHTIRILYPFRFPTTTLRSLQNTHPFTRNVKLRKLVEIILWFLTSILRMWEDFISRTFWMVFSFIEMPSSMELVELCFKYVYIKHISVKTWFLLWLHSFYQKFVCLCVVFSSGFVFQTWVFFFY